MSKDSDSKKIDYIQDKLDSVAETCANIDKEVAVQKTAFDDHMKQDERMYDELSRMNDILQQNTNSLKEHMYQTSLLKDAVLKMDARLQPIEVEYIEKNAVKSWITSRAKLIAKIGGALSALGGVWMFVRHLLH